jgi:CheY-like chemotaxis protein
VAKPLYKDPCRNAHPVPFAKPLVLCIEDEPIHLTLRKKVLEGAGYNVIGVSTRHDALEVVREAPVCAIIADHMLQGTIGTSLAREMKELKPDVAIIIFSGIVPETLRYVDVYLNKGEPTVELLKTVHSVIERFCS